PPHPNVQEVPSLSLPKKLERSSPSPVCGLVWLSPKPNDIWGRVNNSLGFRSFFAARCCITGKRPAPLRRDDHDPRPCADVREARDQLLAQRRSLAEALAGGYKKGRTENQINRIVKIQGAIDVITSAINQDRPASPRRCIRTDAGR